MVPSTIVQPDIDPSSLSNAIRTLIVFGFLPLNAGIGIVIGCHYVPLLTGIGLILGQLICLIGFSFVVKLSFTRGRNLGNLLVCIPFLFGPLVFANLYLGITKTIPKPLAFGDGIGDLISLAWFAWLIYLLMRRKG